MKIVVRSALALCVMCAASFGQAASYKVAVYMSGKYQAEEQGQLVATALTDALAGSESFIVTERTKEFLSTITKENLYQFSGAVDNSQIAEVGKKFGVTYVCVAELMNLGDFFPGSGESMLTARFINVESATIVGATYKIGLLRNEDDIFTAAEKLAGDLITDFKKRGSQAKLDNAAIYSAGGSESGMDKITQPLLINAVVRSGKYAVSERTSSFLETLSQELGTQYSGEVDDNQLAKLGVQSGVKYIMAIKRLSQTRVNLRMIDVKTGVIVPGMSKTGVIDINNVKTIEKSVSELISNFLKMEADTLFTELRQETEEKTRKETAQAQADKTHEWQSMKKFGVNVGVGGSNGATMFGIGATYTLPLATHFLIAPEANLLFGTYENRGYGEANYGFGGVNVPILAQYITSATKTLAIFAEAGAEVDFLVDTDGLTLLNYGPVAGVGVAMNLGSKRIYFDLARFSYGSEYLSYMGYIRVMF